MNNEVWLYFYSFVLITIYAICTLVNLWCLLTMVWLVFDAWFLDGTLILINKVRAYKRRRKFKIIKGRKE